MKRRYGKRRSTYRLRRRSTRRGKSRRRRGMRSPNPGKIGYRL